MEPGRPAREHAALVFVLLLAAFVIRAWAIDQARFTGDESAYWATSRRLATFEEVPVYGPPITGSAANLPGPLYYYLMAVPQRLGASPRFGSLAVVLGHVLLAWLLYRLARAARSERAGAIALALAAFAPWDVLYADRIWGSCVVPVLGSTAIYAAVRSRERPIWQGVLLWICLVLPQLHMSVPLLWATCAAILLLRPPERWSWRALAGGLALAILTYAHPMIREIADGFPNTRMILSEAGGKEPWSTMPPVALRVFGYAWLYATSEIGYHFDRGYWGGTFSDVFSYGAAGWRSWFERHGPLWSAVNVVSMLLGAAAWAVGLVAMAPRVAAAVRERRRSALELGDVLTLSLLVGLAAGSALLFLARKKFFPHYANILMPMLLWPAVAGIETLWASRTRAVSWVAGGALAVSMAGMLSSAVRYYRDVDALNGLGPTLKMVEAVIAEPHPVQISFDHFHNGYAWSVIASVLHHRDLPSAGSSAVRYRVHNGTRFTGEAVPPGSTLYGPVLLERIGPAEEVDPPGTAWRARRSWREAKVAAIDGSGAARVCAAAADLPAGMCRYGDQPWQKYGPESMEIGGKAVEVLFLHPITGSAVRVTFPISVDATKGVIKYALSDAATRTGNPSGVDVRLLQGEKEIGRGMADNTPGFKELAFSLEAGGAREVSLEIRTEQDGARVFGFDVLLAR